MADQPEDKQQRGCMTLTCQMWPSEDVPGDFVSYCPELDVASQGSGVAEAKKHIREAISLHLQTAAEDGELDRVLHQCNLINQPALPSGATSFSETFHIGA